MPARLSAEVLCPYHVQKTQAAYIQIFAVPGFDIILFSSLSSADAKDYFRKTVWGFTIQCTMMHAMEIVYRIPVPIPRYDAGSRVSNERGVIQK